MTDRTGAVETVRERVEESRLDRRPLFLLLVILLVIFGSGIGTIILTDPSPPPSGNETTPTPTVTSTPTPTDGDGTPSETPTPTATPDDQSTPVTPDDTPDDDSDDDDPSNDEPTTPSPGLELGDDGPLFEGSNLAPGDSGQGTLTLRNAEDEDANLTVSAIDLTDHENGITEPESAVDSSPNVGELSSHLEVRLSIRDDAGNQQYLLGTDSDYVPLSDLPSRVPSAEYRLASGEEVTLITDWRLPSSTGNEVQSDGVVVDGGLTLQSTD